MENSWMIFNFANDAKWLIIEGHDPHKCPFFSNYDFFYKLYSMKVSAFHP
jgi:hypothetical protein